MIRRTTSDVHSRVRKPQSQPEVLQKLMRHQSYKTTLCYINQSQQIADTVQGMQIPDVLRKKCG